MFFDPGAARGGFAFAHQHIEACRRFGVVVVAQKHGQQAARVRVHRRFPQLLGVHLAQALEARDAPHAFLQAFFFQLVFDRQQLARVERIQLLDRLLAARRHVDAEQRRARDADVPVREQRRKVFEEQSEQQHLDVRAVDVGIGQDADLAVAQTGQVGRVARAVRIDADRHRDIVDFIVGEQAVAVGFPRVEHLAAQRQDGLEFLVAAHLGRAAGRVALDQEQLVARDVVRFAIGQFARQHGHARRFFLFDFLQRAQTRLRLADHEFGQLLAVFDVLVQPQFERRPGEGRDQLERIARIQALFRLALELRVQHLGRQHERDAREHVFGQQLDAFRQQAMQLDEVLDGAIQAVAQARFVRAAADGGDQVDVGFTHHAAFFGPGHDPGRAFAFGKTVVAGGRVLRAFEQRDQGFAGGALRQRFGQVAAQALVVAPGLHFALGVRERDRHARQQHGFRAQQALQVVHRDGRRIEVFAVRPGRDARAVLLAAALEWRGGEGFDHVAGGEHQLVLAVALIVLAPDFDLEALGQRIGDRDADAVQAARERIRAARAFVELAAGVQAREHDLDRGHAFFGVDADRDAAAVIFDRDRAVRVHRDADVLAIATQRLIGGVVDHFLDDVERIFRAGVHARTLFHRFESLEDADG